MSASSNLENQEWTCKLCNHIIMMKPLSCLICDNNYHENCAKRLRGTFIGNCDYVCKKCDNEYFAQVRHLLDSDSISEENKKVIILLMNIIESKDEIIASKNSYIKLLQTKIQNQEDKLKALSDI
ncbi:hypothetical protein WA026_011913 [Henosepilachna vigintioctopunctata]|uniref:Phorbol-ester/DAG-type domain-containing protein n=1 Tax=Henosepilachna vigintioctopunctata TaxID=420089 RepID=A0AAW1UAK7_9CUCU